MRQKLVTVLNGIQKSNKLKLATFAIAFMVIGGSALLITRAASTFSSHEAENSVIVSPVITGDDANASGGKYAQFGTATTTPPPPTPSTSFQPSAPYHATFLYPWYKNKATDGAYSYWQDGGNTPPTKWFGHYLPDSNPAAFDPAAELYSSNNYDTFKWQVSKMAEAKMEVSIASWFGQGSKQDTSIKTYLNDFMARPDNPYPNLRWALYYECEGITVAESSDCTSTTGDPTTTQLVADLTYIKNNFASSPYFLRVNNKPVIFVYGSTEGLATSQRWKDANAQLGNYFHVVLKVYSGYQTDPNQPDSWHQYGPASNYGIHGTQAAYVSPGFWKDVSDPVDGAVRLARDLTRFQADVAKLAAANVTWRTVQTWNEWGEGSSVEPGTQTLIDSTGKEVADPNGAVFGNAYVQALADRLPALESGTGKTVATTGQPNKVVASAKQSSNVLGTATYSFTAGGDSGIRANADATLAKIVSAAPAFNLLLGDLDYDDVYGAYNGANDADYCTYVKSKLSPLGTNFPFQIVSGNHEEQGGVDGYIMNHAACLPDKMNSTGAYARQYYFDYPAATPNLRTIMIAANLQVENVNYVYTKGSPYYNWLSSSIDDARAKGIKWIVVGMHKTCISVGEKQSCEIGKDLFNLLLEKKVDVILQGHDHNYQRSKQLALSPACTTIVTAGFDADCVVSSGDNYTKGAGPVLLINGVFGKCCYATSSTDAEVGYFAKYQSSNTSGVTKFTVTDDKIEATYLNSSGTFTDSFTIGGAATADTTAPAVELTSPSNNAAVSSMVTLSANATDAVGVSKVDFLVDGATVNTDTTSPYSFSWQSTAASNGQHSIQARAYDAAGNQSASNIAVVTINNGCVAPTSTIGSVTYVSTAPAGTYSTWVRIMAPNTTNNSVYVTAGSLCNAVLGDSTSIPANQWVWVNTGASSTSTASARFDSSSTAITLMGREAGVKVDRVLFLSDACAPTGTGDNCTTTPDATAPIVQTTAPLVNASVSGSIAFSADASDPESGIAKVEFLIDGTIIGTDTSTPYSTTSDTTPLKPGAHTFTAKAYNGAGLTSTSQVGFTVKDVTGPQVSIASPTSGSKVSANSQITANATDNSTLAKAEFFVGTTLIETVTGIGPYAVSWDTWQVANGTHSLSVKAYDAAGNSTTSSAVSVNVDNDITPPSTPTNVSATAQSSTSVFVTWSASTDNTGVAGYYVARNGTVLADLPATSLSYTDTTVTAQTSYAYTVIAYDSNKNQSPASQPANVQPPAPPTVDTTPPSTPANLTADVVSSSQINLSWSPSTDTGSGVKEYRIFRNNVQVVTVQTTSYGDTGLTAATTYAYKVVAVDGANNSSAASLTVSASTNPIATTELVFKPTADTLAHSGRTTRNYGTKTSLEVDGSPKKISYMKFNVSTIGDKQVDRAILRLKVYDSSSSGGSFHKTDSTWSETTLNWNNKPALGSLVGTIGNSPRGSVVEVDLTSLISGDGTYSLGISSTNSNGVDYFSRESAAADQPQLVVKVR